MRRASAPRFEWKSIRRWSVFLTAVLILFITLVGLDLNGSSLAVFSAEPEANGLIEGTPRGIRSDEFLLQTPNAISSVEQGLPATAWIGLSEVDQAVAAGGGPTLDWSTIFKPQTWGFVLFGASYGLSVSWWLPFALSLWGCFALFGVLTRRPLLASGLAIVATFTPYSGWWTPSLNVGTVTLAAAAILGAWMVRSKAWALVLSVAGGLMGAAFALALYPPWQVSLALVIVAIGVGFALDRRIPWRRFAWTLGVAIAIAGGVVLAWAIQHRPAIQTIAETYYPGQRQTTAGTGSLATLLSAPANFWMTGDAGASLGMDGRVGPYANLSESSSSWFPLPVLILGMVGAVFILVRVLRSKQAQARGASASAGIEGVPANTAAEPAWTLVIVSAVTLLLLAWTFLPLPAWFGAVTQLQLVQPSRTSLALGLAAITMAALATTVRRRPRVWGWPWLAASRARCSPLPSASGRQKASRGMLTSCP